MHILYDLNWYTKLYHYQIIYSMMYRVLYLPVDKPLEDGCDVIDSSGKVFTYDESNDTHKGWVIKRAEMFIVGREFNIDKVVGKPSPAARKWLKEGMEVKVVDCEHWYYHLEQKKYTGRVRDLQIGAGTSTPETTQVIRVRCQCCQNLH